MAMGQSTPFRGQGDMFEIRGVTPGSYTLMVDTAEQRKRVTYRQPVEVGPSGIDDLLVSIPPPTDLTGQIRMDKEGPIDFSAVTVNLRPRDPLPGVNTNVKAKQDGVFTLESLMPDRY